MGDARVAREGGKGEALCLVVGPGAGGEIWQGRSSDRSLQVNGIS